MLQQLVGISLIAIGCGLIGFIRYRASSRGELTDGQEDRIFYYAIGVMAGLILTFGNLD